MIAIIALSLVAPSVLSAPRQLPSPEVVVVAPRLDRLAEITAWARQAGEKSVMLRPENWRGELTPVLQVDATSADALTAAGIEPTGAGVLSVSGNTKVGCVSLRDPKAYDAKMAEKLKTIGEPWKSTANGARFAGAKNLDQVVAGYVIKGRDACSATNQGRSVEAALQAVLSGPAPKPSSAPLVIIGRGVTTTLHAAGPSLTADGVSSGALGLPQLAGAGPSPYAAVSPSGLAFVRLRTTRAGTESVLRFVQAQLIAFCPGCDRPALEELSKALLPHLTGNMAWRADGVKVRESLRTDSLRYFALHQASAVEVDDGAAVQKLLAPLESWRTVRKDGGGYVLTLRDGDLRLGVSGAHFYLANDAAAQKALLDALADAGAKKAAQAHGLEFAVDPQLVARGLSQISLLDVVGSNEMAALFGVATELGPLLAASERVSGSADSADSPGSSGGNTFTATWTLGSTVPKSQGTPPGTGK